MVVRRLCSLVLALLVAPGLAWAAPEGKIVIAQGVDPTTLDTQNQQETPASVVASHLFDTLVERDQNLKIVPALAAELPKLVAPTTWEVKLRRGVKFHNGEEFNAESVKFSLERVKTRAPGQLELPAHREGGDRGPLHGARADEQAVADLHHDHDLPPGVDVPAQGLRGQGLGVHLEEPDRHRALQARPLEQGRGDRARGQRPVLARRAQDQDGGVPAHPRRRGAGGRAPERGSGRGGEHPAAPGHHHRQPSRRSSSPPRRRSARCSSCSSPTSTTPSTSWSGPTRA